MTHSLDVGRRRHVAKHRNDGITRHQVNEREGDGCNTERDWNQREQAAAEVCDQGAITPTALSQRASRAMVMSASDP